MNGTACQVWSGGESRALDDCELDEARGEVEMGLAFVPAPEMKRLGP
jgi:hypothetical protein